MHSETGLYGARMHRERSRAPLQQDCERMHSDRFAGLGYVIDRQLCTGFQLPLQAIIHARTIDRGFQTTIALRSRIEHWSMTVLSAGCSSRGSSGANAGTSPDWNEIYAEG